MRESRTKRATDYTPISTFTEQFGKGIVCPDIIVCLWAVASVHVGLSINHCTGDGTLRGGDELEIQAGESTTSLSAVYGAFRPVLGVLWMQ
jgi:hypothetical protein